MKLILPWPPSNNVYYRHVGKKVLLSAAARQYHQLCRVVLQRVPRRSISGKLSVAVQAYLPDLRRRDLDNLLKASLDTLVNCEIIEDDSHIHDCRITKFPVFKGGKLEVDISPFTPPWQADPQSEVERAHVSRFD